MPGPPGKALPHRILYAAIYAGRNAGSTAPPPAGTDAPPPAPAAAARRRLYADHRALRFLEIAHHYRADCRRRRWPGANRPGRRRPLLGRTAPGGRRAGGHRAAPGRRGNRGCYAAALLGPHPGSRIRRRRLSGGSLDGVFLQFRRPAALPAGARPAAAAHHPGGAHALRRRHRRPPPPPDYLRPRRPFQRRRTGQRPRVGGFGRGTPPEDPVR